MHFQKRISGLLTFVLVIALTLSMGAQSDSTVVDQQEPVKKEKKEKKRKDEFKIYAGVNFNNLSVSSETYKSSTGIGWMLGFDYKRGKFFYWQVGARYNNAVYNLVDQSKPADSSSLLDGVFSIRSVDVPITVGINFLSFASRIVGLRLFVGATPQFVLGVGGNDLGISKDNLNTFNLLGQGGIGVDVAFIYLETGVNLGFIDLFQNDKSKPVQIFLNLGFRF